MTPTQIEILMRDIYRVQGYVKEDEMESIYADIDKKIISKISNGVNTYSDICLALDANDWRLIDRRLQSLRKKGLISYHNARWIVLGQ